MLNSPLTPRPSTVLPSTQVKPAVVSPLSKPQIDLTKEVNAISNMYEGDTLPEYYKILVFGGAGTGKTGLVQTCPLPILYHSFDRNGWMTIREFARDKSKILIDRRFEGEFGDRTNMGKGKMLFERWEDEFKRLNSIGFFSLVGTYVIDSATTWALSALDAVMKSGGKVKTENWIVARTQTPDQKDWQVQMNAIKLALFDFLHIPCNCLFIMHETVEKDDLTGAIRTEPLMTGKLKEQVPPDFDEVYRAISVGGATPEFKLMTMRDGNITSRSRLSGIPPKLDKFEPMDIRAILKKGGANWQDKPLFKIGA